MDYVQATIPLTPGQSTIVDWLRLRNAPGVAEAYIAALEIENRASFPGDGSLLAHCLRDMLNGLGTAFGAPRGQTQYAPLVTALDTAWVTFLSTASPAADGVALRLTDPLRETVEALIHAHRLGDDRDSSKFRAVLRKELKDEARADQIEPVAQAIKVIKSLAPGAAHFRGTEETRTDLGQWVRELRAVEQALLALASPFFTHVNRSLDDILGRANEDRDPTPDEVSFASLAIARPEFRAYFFQHLRNARWILPLQKAGWFKEAPPRMTKANTVEFPPWPPGAYLRRMSENAEAHEALIGVLSEVDDGQNVYVQTELIEIALSLPPAAGATYAKRFIAWTDAPNSWTVVRKLRPMVIHLANHGEAAAALAILERLLAIDRQRRPSDHRGEVRPRVAQDSWQYVQILDDDLPMFESRLGYPLVNLLCELLQQAAATDPISGGAYEDGSLVWRREITEGHERTDIRGALVSAIVRIVGAMLLSDGASFGHVAEILLRPQQLILDRMTIYFLLSNERIDVPRQVLESADLFEVFPPEYQRLLRARVDQLRPADRRRLWDWFHRGPDLDVWRTNYRAFRRFLGAPDEGTEAELEQAAIDQALLEWRGERLWALEGDPEISGALVAELHGLQADGVEVRRSAPARPQISARSSGLTDELQYQTTDEIVAGLNAMSSLGTGSGLSKTPVSSSTVAQDPGPIAAALSDTSSEVPPAVLEVFLDGFRQAITQGKQFEWTGIIRRARGLVAVPEANRESDDLLRIRGSVAHLLLAALQANLPFSVSELDDIEFLFLELSAEAGPSRDEELRQFEDEGDCFSLAINRTRGVAFLGLLSLAIRKRQELGKEWSGVRCVPLILAAFEREIGTRPSLMMRAILGQRFPWVCAMDGAWARKLAGLIFDDGPFFSAGWNPFVRFTEPFIGSLDNASGAYERAVADLDTSGPASTRRDEVQRRLGGHLLWYYVWDRIPLNESGGLLEQFFIKAPPKLRRNALETLGRDISLGRDVMPDPVRERLQVLWESRVTAVRTGDIEDREELLSFGSWFDCSRLDPAWLLARLIETIHLTESSGPGYAGSRVLERLASFAPQFPTETAECVRLMIAFDREGWLLFGSEAIVRRILAPGMGAGGAARASAEGAIDLLGRRGFHDFRDLLGALDTATENGTPASTASS